MPLRLVLLLLLALPGCATLAVAPASRVTRTERTAAEVSLCLLTQERAVKPMWQGVAQASFDDWQYTIASVLVRHPAGLTVIDPAFGRAIREDLHKMGVLAQLAFGDERTKTPLVDVLARAGVKPEDVAFAIPTHAHWDHIGALPDLPNAKVLMSRREAAWARTLRRRYDSGVMPHHLAAARSRTVLYDFTGPPVDGFAASYDLFGDGSVVAVPMPGHTPGSVALLVRAQGKTWLFAGDTSWTMRGIELPAHKTLPMDFDRDEVAEQLGVLNAFLKYRPDVVLVPAHDASALEKLPPCAR